MADIVLAEHQGRAWLVSGEQYIDDLLANRLPSDISIDIVSCASHADVTALLSPEDTGKSFWAIHPGIVKRLRRGLEGYTVLFSQWSALLDDDAGSVIRGAADLAALHPEAAVMLTSYAGADAPPMARALSELRKNLLEAVLIEHGVARARIAHISCDPAAGETDRFDIIINRD
jgi:hypothetical protein